MISDMSEDYNDTNDTTQVDDFAEFRELAQEHDLDIDFNETEVVQVPIRVVASNNFETKVPKSVSTITELLQALALGSEGVSKVSLNNRIFTRESFDQPIELSESSNLLMVVKEKTLGN
jgi:hypothetical protein